MAKEIENLQVLYNKDKQPTALCINPRFFSKKALEEILLYKVQNTSCNTTFAIESDKGTWHMMPSEMIKIRELSKRKQKKYIRGKAKDMAYANTIIIVSVLNTSNTFKN